MKYATIIGVVLLIIIIGVVVSRPDNDNTPTSLTGDTPNTVVVPEPTLAVTDIELESDEHNEDLTGNDIGMEYPYPDQTAPATEPAAVPGAVAFTVKGTDFAYDIKEIRVKQGDTVIINFESEAGFHDWVVDEFAARTEKVRAGGTTSVTFVADKTGTFEYYCSVGAHRANGMVGNLIVE